MRRESGCRSTAGSRDLPFRRGHSLRPAPYMKTPSFALVILCLACTDAPERGSPASSSAVLEVHATQRASFEIVGADTLSDSARIIRIIPEQDGDGVIALFTDPARRVSSGLAIVDRRMSHPQLLWPDSVTSVWWTGPHMLAFTTTTGQGIRLVVDVHAATLKIADTTSRGVQSPPVAAVADSSVIGRSRAFIDSIHMQPAGVPQGSALTYSVTRVVPSPDGRLAAFHAAARDPAGTVTNPGWFILDRASRVVSPVEQVTGLLSELPAEAGEWAGNSSFLYAKGRAVWDAEVGRTSPQAKE